jgi:hypothetical protein
MMAMHDRRAKLGTWSPRLAWLVWAINVALWAAMLLLVFVPRPIHTPVSFVLQRVSNYTFILSAATVGAFVAWRRPSNPIGWLLCAAALCWTIIDFLAEYGLFALVEAPGALPEADVVPVIQQVFHVPFGVIVLYLMLLFPSGRLLSPRWALVGWAYLVTSVLSCVGVVLTPGPTHTAMYSLARNPFGVEQLPGFLLHGVAGFLLGVICLWLAAFSLVVRYRRARGMERQQIKWLAFGAVCAVALSFPYTAALAFGFGPGGGVGLEVLPSLVLFGATLLPVAIGIALLRYRLYDIDLLINRTLVYGTVTALLAGAFAALSVVTQRLTLAVTGQESEVAVVLAALIVTALFQPLRSRVQTLVDRRFYRSKYDVSRTLERFASQVRDEVELERLTHSLIAVVQETMQPAHASLWLRPYLDAQIADKPEPN